MRSLLTTLTVTLLIISLGWLGLVQLRASNSYRQFELRLGGYVNAFYGLRGEWPKTEKEIEIGLSPSERVLFQGFVRNLDLKIRIEGSFEKDRCIIHVAAREPLRVRKERYEHKATAEEIAFDTATYGSR